jgi:tRNA-binding protein
MDLTWTEFEKVEMRVGTILEANDFSEARKPAYQLTIDFGSNIGIQKNLGTNH